MTEEPIVLPEEIRGKEELTIAEAIHTRNYLTDHINERQNPIASRLNFHPDIIEQKEKVSRLMEIIKGFVKPESLQEWIEFKRAHGIQTYDL